ncbi:hypothetical protein EB796_022691 [Bugula neritina]|uniref:Uncharacterized protein n=1 Tax=Bugula neritina TaxID=10212 RepID=A0A7J7IYJ8_BUGNE|nr:hypothetical protein EB796_022691 [Bugula neritina]
MDLMTAVSLAGALFVTLLAVTFGYFVILLLLVHAKYDHLPGPREPVSSLEMRWRLRRQPGPLLAQSQMLVKYRHMSCSTSGSRSMVTRMLCF